MECQMKRSLIRLGIILFLGFTMFTVLAMVPVHDQEPDQSKQLRDDVVRFHVMAKSDNKLDQELKLKVRDAVIEYLRPGLEEAEDQQEAATIIQGELDQIQQVAVDTLRVNGSADHVQVFYGEYEFPTRVYGPLTFPKGKYQSLRVVLGAGEGRNWWCCLFPPLCFVDIADSAKGLREEHEQREEVSLKDESSEEREMDQQKERMLLIHSDTELDGSPRLTSKIGEWLQESHDRPLLSRIWQWRS